VSAASSGQPAPTRSAPKLTDLTRRTRAEFESLTGQIVESVTSVRRRDDGWVLCLEVVELERVPASTSILGTYEAWVDDDRSLIEFERTGRYHRNQTSQSDSL
jgi:hypothetical protein